MIITIAAPVEQKRPHEMLQTPWIILYVNHVKSVAGKYPVEGHEAFVRDFHLPSYEFLGAAHAQTMAAKRRK